MFFIIVSCLIQKCKRASKCASVNFIAHFKCVVLNGKRTLNIVKKVSRLIMVDNDNFDTQYVTKHSLLRNESHRLCSGESRGEAWAPPPLEMLQGVVNSSFFPKFIKKMSYYVEFSKYLLHIL